jgi:transitional endoplasmic reticulum ATPase
MLDLSTEIPMAKIIDFGYARSFLQSSKAYNKAGLNLQYVANECVTAGVFSPQSDLFSLGVVMYQMLFGLLPWHVDTLHAMSLPEQREKSLRFPDIAGQIIDFDEFVLNVIQKALHNNPEQRFQTAQDFLQALNGEIEIDNGAKNPKNQGSEKKMNGFAAIAGMQKLKDMLQTDVIDVIQNPEEYRLHNLGLPNGMLLYGPPGCGKTFFAERFAEEAGYHFIKVIASDIASIYVHGTQEKIGKLFDEARKNAPTILYFDELDAMTPDRENTQHSYGAEVNEFLSQLDNIGNSGVFVIGSTNKPQLIDKAILRAGRLEKHFYIPPPDFDARQAMFELYLKDRPIDFGIDYEKLALLTENYVSGDIKLIADEASRKVIREHTKRISMETLEFVIKNQRPTISLDVLKQFEKIRNEMMGIKEERKRVGF